MKGGRIYQERENTGREEVKISGEQKRVKKVEEKQGKSKLRRREKTRREEKT